MIIFCLSFRAQPRNQRGAIQERTRDPAKVRLNRAMRALCTRRVGKQHAYSNRPSRFHTWSPLPLRPHARSALRPNSDSSASLGMTQQRNAPKKNQPSSLKCRNSSSPPLGEITERESRVRKAFFRSLLVSPKSIVIEAQQLRKSYGARLALDCLTLDVMAGEVVGLLGPNGAGKSTTLSILATLLEPDAGTVRIAGLDALTHRAAIRRRLGFVPQSIALYPSLTAAQNLKLFLGVQGLSRGAADDACRRVLDQVGLAERAGDPVATLSGGMQRRLNLACGIAHQ